MPEVKELTTEEKLRKLYHLQKLHSKYDEIQILKGELPMEVRDLEDEITGLETRIEKLNKEIEGIQHEIAAQENKKKEAAALIAKYEKQQMNVKNNREFDALNKEIELQRLEIQLADKKEKELNEELELKKKLLEETQEALEKRKKMLETKRVELEKIIKETEQEEKEIIKQIEKAEAEIEERLLKAYNRIRKSYRNGLAVVKIERDSCGGCFAKIPPQTQLEVASRKKIIQCEHCSRILVDEDIDATRGDGK